MTARKNISQTWKEGRYFDLWVFPHVMTGVAGGFANVFFDLSVSVIFGVGLLLMILWEVFEVVIGIKESWQNQVMDLAVGLVGIAFALAVASRVGRGAQIGAFAVSFVIMMVSGVIGWLASRRKKRATRKGRTAG